MLHRPSNPQKALAPAVRFSGRTYPQVGADRTSVLRCHRSPLLAVVRRCCCHRCCQLNLGGTMRMAASTSSPWSSSPHRDLRITSVFPCVARGSDARASLRFTGCWWWRPLAANGGPGTSWDTVLRSSPESGTEGMELGVRVPRAGAGKILPRPRRTSGGETAGPTRPYAREHRGGAPARTAL